MWITKRIIFITSILILLISVTLNVTMYFKLKEIGLFELDKSMVSKESIFGKVVSLKDNQVTIKNNETQVEKTYTTDNNTVFSKINECNPTSSATKDDLNLNLDLMIITDNSFNLIKQINIIAQ